jgi:asparagine synthetase B (glutamine-hydrolysing)
VGSEHEHAERVAAYIGSRHHCLMLAPGDVLTGMDRWVETFDEPFGDHAALPTMALAEFARQTVKVVLTGEGADEIFGGYDNYAKRVREERVTSVLGAKGSPLPWLLRGLPGRLTRDRILKAILEPARRRYTTISNIFDSALRRSYFTDAFRLATQTTLADRAEAFFTECDSPAYLDRLLNIDTRLWLPDDLLAKVDRATMAFSLEARVPYLDQDLVSWCARLDPALKVGDGGVAKALLKRLAERYLPREVVYRSKQGFTMPLDRWMTNELRPDPSSRDSQALFRAFLGPKKPRHAPLDTAGSRALVCTLPAGFRCVINAPAVDRSYRSFLGMGRPGDPHSYGSRRHARARPPGEAHRAAWDGHRDRGRARRNPRGDAADRQEKPP